MASEQRSESRSLPSFRESAKRLRYVIEKHGDTLAHPYILEAAQLLEIAASSEIEAIKALREIAECHECSGSDCRAIAQKALGQ